MADGRWTSKLGSLSRELHLDSARILIQHVDQAVVNSTSRVAKRGLPKILDRYITRGFLVYLFWSLLVCGSLFIVLTLFDLLDDIIRNRIPALPVIQYFAFLIPHILMLIVPMSLLLAVLISFSVLEKHSEITAIKSGGWSLYRIALPVFIQGAIFCVGMYILQDYVLPYANIHQDSLRNVIKGRPAQTTMTPQRKWILGESNRIYNYDYFDSSKNLFVDLNIYELDSQSSKILRRLRAARGTLDETGRWVLENGWVRDFHENQNSFRRLEKEEFIFSEKPSYFEKEIFQPRESSKLSYPELKEYIKYLKNSGYNATELDVELHKKISFPISCLVMALLGVPFSFSAGKKGAFFGIAMSIAIAMSYWAVYSVFEQMGAYGMLAPLLAAWAPNILFGSAGLALLFTIRT
jgi:LPS export ABC transporter permease LptG